MPSGFVQQLLSEIIASERSLTGSHHCGPISEEKMSVPQEIRDEMIAKMQGAMALNIAFAGISNNVFAALSEMGRATPDELSEKTGLDSGYLNRWCDAAFCFGLLDEEDGRFKLTEQGHSFIFEFPGTTMPFAVQSVLSAHMADHAATLMRTGERPGEKVLAERKNIIALFGPMLEAMFAGIFEQQILPGVPVYQETDEKGGLVTDLGCGSGWYLRRLARHFPNLRGVGLDDFEENINHATKLAEQEGLGDRLKFLKGDIFEFAPEERADLIAMNRALHHVWEERQKVFQMFREHLKEGGYAVIWEPNWPKHHSDLRDPAKRGMAFQNLAEHIQGNRFLNSEEIEVEFRSVGMEAKTYLFANGNEAVVVGRKM